MNPTHRVIATGELVFPDGYDPADLEALADGEWEAIELERVKSDQLAVLTEYRETVVLATVTTDFGTFYADDKSKLLMAGRLLGILLMERVGLTAPTTVLFKTTDGFQTFATDDFITAALQVLGGIESAFSVQSTLETEIVAATTVEDVQAVVWPEGGA